MYDSASLIAVEGFIQSSRVLVRAGFRLKSALEES